MKTKYLGEWLLDFPELDRLLSYEEKEILNEMNPAEYVNMNLTQSSEVIRLINYNKPHAKQWIRLFPNLQHLSTEDYFVLDHIAPTDFIGLMTEEDVMRVIGYRKKLAREKKDREDIAALDEYFKTHRDEIEEEDRKRSEIQSVPAPFTICGSACITTSLRLSIDYSLPLAIIGAALIVVPWTICTIKMNRLNRNTVYPKIQRPTGDKMDVTTLAVVMWYGSILIGTGVCLGSLVLIFIIGWSEASKILFYGLIIMLSLSVITILSIILTHRD